MNGSADLARTRQRRPLVFTAAVLTLAISFSAPIERAAGELFWVHMVQHLLLVTVVAPLLVLSAPWMSGLRLLPARAVRPVTRWRRRRRGATTSVAIPVAAWAAFNVNLVAWHVPGLFDLTLTNSAVHASEHLLFITTGVFFWAQVIDGPLLHMRLDSLGRVVYIASAAVVSWLLSLALTIAPTALYRGYARSVVRPEGLSALSDQRIAASVMLVPGSIAFLIAGLVYLHRWIDEEDHDATPRVRARIVRSHEEQRA
jgi:putative membrane protein